MSQTQANIQHEKILPIPEKKNQPEKVNSPENVNQPDKKENNQGNSSLENSINDSGNAPLITSPRSLEAMRRQGLSINDLRRVTKDDISKMLKEKFGVADDKSINKFTSHFEKLRTERITALLEERKKVIEEESKGEWVAPSTLANSHSQSKTAHDKSMVSSASTGQKNTITLIENEKKILDKIKKRQMNEIQSLIDQEERMEKMQKKNAEKLEKQLKREKEYQADLEKRRKQVEEKRVKQEEDRRKQMEQENLEQKKKAEEIYKKELQMAEKKKEEKKKKKKEAEEREVKKRQQQDLFVKQTEEILTAQQGLIEKKRHEQEIKEGKRREAIEKFRQKKKKMKLLKVLRLWNQKLL